MSDAPILAGALTDADLPSILGVTSLGRQTIRLEVFSAAGSLVGSAVLKAGRILTATAGAHTGRAALDVMLSVQKNARFRIAREPGAIPDGQPIAIVDELVASASASEAEPPPLPPARIRVMDGSLQDFDVATLLQTVGLGRQQLQLDILGSDRRVIGWVVVKAGKLISAKAGDIEGIAAVRELLDASSDLGFAVYRLDAEVGAAEPLGAISQVLFHAASRDRHSSPPAPRTPVMRGALSEFDVPTVLYTLAIARQYNCIELYDQNETVGAIYAKAGMIMAAHTAVLEGLAAFRVLVNSPPHLRFSVFRVSGEVTGEPLGSIHQLLTTAGGPVAAAPEPLPAASAVALPSTGAAPAVARTSSASIPQMRDFSNSERLTSLTNRVGVMVGNTTDFSVRTLLETLTEIRQRTVVELIDGDTMIGSIHVKAGKLLGARTETLSGVAAFRWLLSTPGHLQFRVFRYPGESHTRAEPIGSLHSLLSSPTATGAVAIGLEPETTHRGTVHVPRYVWIATGIVAAAAAILMVWRPAPRIATDVASTPSANPTSTAQSGQGVGEEASGSPAEVPAAAQTAAPQTGVASGAAAVNAATPIAAMPTVPTPAPTIAGIPAASPRPVPQQGPRKLSVWKAQVMLRKLGYAVGPIDNFYGPRTQAAVLAFQRAMSLSPSGGLDEETVGLLMEKSPLKD